MKLGAYVSEETDGSVVRSSSIQIGSVPPHAGLARVNGAMSW